jgi:hypothetical protein
MTAPPASKGIVPSWTWGSSTRLLSVDNTMSPSAQLAAVTLPEPAVCSLYFQVQIVTPSSDLFAAISAFTLNLLQGVGRVVVPRQISFDSQPSVGGPIEFTLPFVPLHALQVNVQQICHDIVSSPIETEIYLVLSPLTRIAQNKVKDAMVFGMALPGEADSLDDQQLEELETESPTVNEIMRADFAPSVEGAGDEGDEGDEGEEERDEEPRIVSPEKAIIQDIVRALTSRLGRRPSRREAMDAVARFQSRLIRRSLRGAR